MTVDFQYLLEENRRLQKEVSLWKQEFTKARTMNQIIDFKLLVYTGKGYKRLRGDHTLGMRRTPDGTHLTIMTTCQ